MNAVTLEVEDRKALLSRYYPNGRGGGLTIDGLCASPVGDSVSLMVVVRKPPRTFALNGRVAWARRKGNLQLNFAVCWGLDLHPEDAAAHRVLAWARAELAEAALRSQTRSAVQLPAQVEADGVARRVTISDVSSGGAFVRSWSPLPQGTRVTLGLRLPRSLFVTRVRARVAWVRHAGRESGMGLMFAEGDERASWAKVLAKLGLS